ncbi:MAG: NosD domain-containing protein, partial [Candidatus Nanoarchaeia archaeon]
MNKEREKISRIEKTIICMLIASICLVFLVKADIIPCNSCKNCSETIHFIAVAGDTVQLANNISDYQYMHCINLSKSNIILDCNGYTISNDTVGGFFRDGVHIYGAPSNVVIKNCMIENFYTGVYAENYAMMRNLTVKDSTFRNNNHGLHILGAVGSTFDNLQIFDTESRAIEFEDDQFAGNGGNTSTFSNIVIDNCFEGIDIFGPNGLNSGQNLIQNVTISQCNTGISFWETTHNTLRDVNIVKRSDDSYWSIAFPTNTYNYLDDPSSHIHDIDESNTVNGLPIMYYDSYYRECPDNEVIEHNNTYSIVGLNNCFNVTIQNTNPSDTLGVFYTTNSTFRNMSINNTFMAVQLYYGSGNTFSDLTLWNNYDSIYTYLTTNNTFSNLNIRESDIYFYLSDYNLIENSTIDNGSTGIYLYGSLFNTIRNNNITNNEQGVALIYEEWDYMVGSNYNNITGCNISGNNQGVYIDLDSVGSNIYNNILANTENAYIENDQNFWNTTKTSGTNIMGGPYLAGNFWSDYGGSDGDSDGIGDTEYEIASDATDYDYLPLVAYTPTDTTPPTMSLEAPDNNAINTTTNTIDF